MGGKLGVLLLIASVLLCILSYASPSQTSELVPSKIIHHDVYYEVLKSDGGGGKGGGGRGGGGKKPGPPGGGKNPAPKTDGEPSGSGGKGGGGTGGGGTGGGSRRSSGELSANVKGVTWLVTLSLVMVLKVTTL